MQASGILFALVLYCLSLLPFSPSLSLSQLFHSLQPASPQTGGQATPLRSPRYERRVTEADNTANCSIFFEEIKYSVWFGDFAVALPPPPPVDRALMQKEREIVIERKSWAVHGRRVTNEGFRELWTSRSLVSLHLNVCFDILRHIRCSVQTFYQTGHWQVFLFVCFFLTNA